MKIKNLLLIFVSLTVLYSVISCTHQGETSFVASVPQTNVQPDALTPKFHTPVTQEEVRSAYYKYSAPSVVRALHENNAANGDMIMDKVSSGDAGWISTTAAGQTPERLLVLLFPWPMGCLIIQSPYCCWNSEQIYPCFPSATCLL